MLTHLEQLNKTVTMLEKISNDCNYFSTQVKVIMDKKELTNSHNMRQTIRRLRQYKEWEAGNNDKTLIQGRDIQVSEGNLFCEIKLKISDIKTYETYEAIAILIFQSESGTHNATIL